MTHLDGWMSVDHWRQVQREIMVRAGQAEPVNDDERRQKAQGPRELKALDANRGQGN